MLTQFSRKSNQCCCTFRAFGPVLSQFSHVRKLQQHWWTSVAAVFAQPGFARKLRNTGGPVLPQFSRKFCAKIATTLVDQSCRSFRTCENCSNTGGPVLLQFSHNPGLCENCETLVDQSCRSFRANQVLRENCNTLVDQSCCSFRTTGVCVKVAKHWWTSLVAVFTQNGFA